MRTPKQVSHALLLQMKEKGIPGLFYAENPHEGDEQITFTALDISDGECLSHPNLQSKKEAIDYLTNKPWGDVISTGEDTNDDEHPDGSISKISYWTRKKLSELDGLLNEVEENMPTDFDPNYLDYEEFITKLADLRNDITSIQEGEGWI